MAITSAFVLYAVTWFLTMLIALPIGLKTQGDLGDKIDGTQDGAPANYNPKRKALWVTIIATGIWAALMAFLLTTDLTWRDFDWTAKLPPVSES